MLSCQIAFMIFSAMKRRHWGYWCQKVAVGLNNDYDTFEKWEHDLVARPSYCYLTFVASHNKPNLCQRSRICLYYKILPLQTYNSLAHWSGYHQHQIDRSRFITRIFSYSSRRNSLPHIWLMMTKVSIPRSKFMIYHLWLAIYWLWVKIVNGRCKI